MSEFDEDTGYLVIAPGDRVFIEYDDARLTKEWGGWGTVIKVKKGDLAVIKTDRDGLALSRPRVLLRAKPSS